jgi:predicted nucleotide-binding protein
LISSRERIKEMDKSLVFITSSGRALTLADKLADELNQTDYCEATLWTKEGQAQPTATIIEMLEKASAKYDFAVIILAKDDVMVKDIGKSLKARDNCIFEAGLFMGALGRERCFLVVDVKEEDLPSDLGGIIHQEFSEPENLGTPQEDRSECAKAIAHAVQSIKDYIDHARKQGDTARNKSLVNLLSWRDLLEKEKLATQGGNLEEGQVVVTETQPVETKYLPASRVRQNIDQGVSYIYFFHGDELGAQRICWLLQMILLAPMFKSSSEKEANDFDTRQKKVKEGKTQVLEDLRKICTNQSVKIIALPDRPILQYCIHNANNPATARAYLKCKDDKYLEWATGSEAFEFWKAIKQEHVFKPKKTRAMFYEAIGLDGRKLKDYYDSIDQHMALYFPGIDDEVRKLCVEGIPRNEPG